MKEYLNVRYRGVRPVHILIYIILGGVGTVFGIPIVAEPYGLDDFALGLVVGVILGFFIEVFIAD